MEANDISFLRNPNNKENFMSDILRVDDFTDIIPSKEFLQHYREKLKEVTKNYYELLERVESWQPACDLSFKLEQDLMHRTNEVSKLRQTVSDLQISIHEERAQALYLRTENDRLKLQVAQDRKKINFLLELSNLSDEEVSIFLHSTRPDKKIVPRIFLRQKMSTDPKDSPKSQDSEKNMELEILHNELHALQADMEEQIRFHNEQVNTLLHDRGLTRKEWSREQRKLQAQIMKISNRLKDVQDKFCDSTRELVALQKDTEIKEFRWKLEKEAVLRNLECYQDRLGDNYLSNTGTTLHGSGYATKGRSPRKLCIEVDSLKDELHEKEATLNFLQEKSTSLELEAKQYKDLLEKSRKKYADLRCHLTAQVAYLKKKYEDLDHRRRLEAEGFHNDVKILRKRLQEIEKTVHKYCRKQISSSTGSIHAIAIEQKVPLEKLYSTAQETKTKSLELERELKNIMQKVKDIECSISKHAKS